MEEESTVLKEFAEIPADPPEKRETCERCRRPCTVCWCPFLPPEPFDVKSQVIILQHPFEESRCLRTAPMLKYGLKEDRCLIFKGKRFNPSKIKELGQAMKGSNTLLLYPGPDAVDLEEHVKSDEYQSADPACIILLDGTWMQARGMYNQNKFLQSVKQVQLNTTATSKYVIRTQPTEGALSTLETGAIALSLLEQDPNIVEPLIEPLKALCDFQIQHGAVHHHSKQYLIENGIYEKPLARSYKNKIMKMGAIKSQTSHKSDLT